MKKISRYLETAKTKNKKTEYAVVSCNTHKEFAARIRQAAHEADLSVSKFIEVSLQKTMDELKK